MLLQSMKEQSKYAPYSKEEVEAKVQALTQIVENDTDICLLRSNKLSHFLRVGINILKHSNP
jgi:hypothetical protein